MKLITYAEAASILGVSVQTLKQALEPDRNALTRAGRKGTNGLLIEEQVRLFMGSNPRTGHRKRLSLNALSSDELALWHRYASDFNTSQSAGQQVTPEIERLIDEKIGAFARLRMTQIEKEEQIRETEKEILRPFLERELSIA